QRQGGDEVGLGGGRVQGDADLLGRRRGKEQGAADAAPGQQQPGRRSRRAAGRLSPAAADRIKDMGQRPQKGHRQPAAAGQKGEGRKRRPGALGYKGQAPDQSAEHQQQGVSGL